MARSFQSLAPDELERVFGPPEDGSCFSFIGLNVISPLLQGMSLSPLARHQFSLQLKLSEDPDIRAFVEHRLQKQKDNHATKPHLFPRLTREACQKALREVVDAKPELQPYLENFHYNGMLSPRANKTEDSHFSWLSSALEEAGSIPNSDESMRLLLPVGCRGARLGMILGEGAWGSCAGADGLIPRELHQYGFDESNILLWTVDFRRLEGIARSPAHNLVMSAGCPDE